jgi:hypothetical protein
LPQHSGAGAVPIDLLTALRASVEAAKERKSTARSGRSRRTTSTHGGAAVTKKPKKLETTGRGAGPPKKRS